MIIMKKQIIIISALLLYTSLSIASSREKAREGSSCQEILRLVIQSHESSIKERLSVIQHVEIIAQTDNACVSRLAPGIVVKKIPLPPLLAKPQKPKFLKQEEGCGGGAVEEVKEEEKESPILFGMKTMTKPKYERAEGVTKYWSPFFSPLSAIYNVPTEEPTAAERLAVLHLIFFAADFVAVKTGANAEGGFFFSTFALFADAVKTQNEWWRLPSTALADFGLGHVVATNASLWLIGREIETLLGTMSFLAVYFLGAMGGAITALAFDDNSKVIAGSSGAVFALYGAILTYTVLNLESGWNQRGFTTRLFRIGASATALCYIASETASDGVTHVVNNWDHFGGFLSGIFLAYYGLCPLFSSIQFKPGEEKRRAQRLNLEDKTLQEPFGKTSAILYGVCANLVAASAVVAFKRMSGVDDF